MVEDFGIKSMLCTQLFTNEKQLGALNIYSTESDAFDEEDQEVARLLAVHAAMAVGSVPAPREGFAGNAAADCEIEQDSVHATLRRIPSMHNTALMGLGLAQRDPGNAAPETQ